MVFCRQSSTLTLDTESQCHSECQALLLLGLSRYTTLLSPPTSLIQFSPLTH
jgi:hypothetical protein